MTKKKAVGKVRRWAYCGHERQTMDLRVVKRVMRQRSWGRMQVKQESEYIYLKKEINRLQGQSTKDLRFADDFIRLLS